MRIIKPLANTLLILLLAYTVASIFHFVHNAVFLNSYPNMPGWISQAEVFGALAALITLGVFGYLLYIFHYRVWGLVVIGVYAVLGFDGLAHYSLAPVSAHDTMMNLTIWMEASMALFLLINVVCLLMQQVIISFKEQA